MSLFNFNMEELLTFFAVLIRYSVLISVLPFVGDRMIPQTIKILLSLAVTLALFPLLIRNGNVHPQDARIWGATAGGIISTVCLEMVFAMILGFTARVLFDGISFGGNLVGTFMGFASASFYDPHQESQSQLIAHLQMTLAMLVFLALDGHHLMLRASLESYRIVGLGKITWNAQFYQRMITLTAETFRFGLQLAAPVAVATFAVNVVFGVLSKAMPQLNIFMLSAAVTALVGFVAMYVSIPEFQGELGVIFGKLGDWLEGITMALAPGR